MCTLKINQSILKIPLFMLHSYVPKKVDTWGLPQVPYLPTDLQNAHFVEDEQKYQTGNVRGNP